VYTYKTPDKTYYIRAQDYPGSCTGCDDFMHAGEIKDEQLIQEIINDAFNGLTVHEKLQDIRLPEYPEPLLEEKWHKFLENNQN
jgi:hypothetical protein